MLRVRREDGCDASTKAILIIVVVFCGASTLNLTPLVGNQFQYSASGVIAILRYIDSCPGLPCRARRLLPARCRPKCISVIAWGAPFPGVFSLVQ